MNYTIEHGRMKFSVRPTKTVAPDLTKETAEFEAACAEFRAVCKQIGELIGNPSFQGGFDEISLFKKHEAANTMQGLILALNWSSANDACTYLGAKIGLGQPDWWYQCWEQIG